VRKADIFAPACIQPWAGNPDPSLVSEDCLYLNVWTAAATAKVRRPVMVWIRGGGLTGGMSWEHLSYGTKLAPECVVLVTIAYRLGAFGFLAAPELTRESGQGSGNYDLAGLLASGHDSNPSKAIITHTFTSLTYTVPSIPSALGMRLSILSSLAISPSLQLGRKKRFLR
jgi:hypothetical protein